MAIRDEDETCSWCGAPTTGGRDADGGPACDSCIGPGDEEAEALGCPAGSEHDPPQSQCS